MCGIIGAVRKSDVLPVLLDGLKRLEYRGYDSAGIAVIANKSVSRVRSVGKIAALEQAIQTRQVLHGTTGIAHTRWATHGPPTEINAHPHISEGRIALVCNGIVENHEEIRQKLMSEGMRFVSQTDTEVIVNLVSREIRQGKDLLEAVKETTSMLEGAYAIGVVSADEPDRLVGARHGSPLVVGIGDGESYIASDMSALLPVTRDFFVLENGDIVDIQENRITIVDQSGRTQSRPVKTSSLSLEAVELGNHRHFMSKEIHEQDQSVSNTLEGRITGTRILEACFGNRATQVFDRIRSVQIIACGTSFHAGLVARHWFEEHGIPCQVEIGSEFHSRIHAVPEDSLVVSLSQSGETRDTLSALEHAMESGYAHSLAICNVPDSSLVRNSELVLMTHAGPEIGVASTKAFTTHLVALRLLVIALGRRFRMTETDEARLVRELRELPKQIRAALEIESQIRNIARQFVDKHHALFLGRGIHYPIALEGALKLKEISYIHAEAYPAGELKHGPLALVDNEMPVVSVAPNDRLLNKLKGNIEEVRARGGKLIVFADSRTRLRSQENLQVIHVAPVDSSIAPIIFTIPLQMLAYHVGLIKGTDVDRPRNLAKSVTVE